MIQSEGNPLANFCEFREERNILYLQNVELPTAHDQQKRSVALLEKAAEADVLVLMAKYHVKTIAITPMSVYHTAIENSTDATVLVELRPYHAMRVIERILVITGFRKVCSMWVKECYDQ